MRKLSQRELAERSGVSLRTLQDYEQGRKNINLAAAITVQKLAEALGCASWELLEDE
jgi:transcriptional regulator with XRE-family HTH domain